MRARAVAILVAASAGCPGVVRAEEKAEAVLLGLRGPDDTLTTAIADSQGIQVLGSGVAVPRKDGWWRIDMRQRTWKADDDGDPSSEEHVVVHPAGTPLPPQPESSGDCDANDTVALLFASPDAFALDSNGGGMCAGAAHPYVFSSLGTNHYGQPCAAGAKDCQPYIGAPIAITELLGKAVSSRMDASAAKLNAKDSCVADSASPSAWGPIRSKGRWIARALLGYESEACREAAGTTFTVEGLLPDSFTGPDKLPSSWEAITAAYPGAVDAVASPSGSLLVVIDAKSVSVYAGGKRVGSLAQPKSALVMAQWALGKAGERWRKEAAAALKE